MTLLSFPFCLVLDPMMICSTVAVQGWDGERVWWPWGTNPKLVVGQQHPLAHGFPAGHPWVHSQTWPVLRPCRLPNLSVGHLSSPLPQLLALCRERSLQLAGCRNRCHVIALSLQCLPKPLAPRTSVCFLLHRVISSMAWPLRAKLSGRVRLKLFVFRSSTYKCEAPEVQLSCKARICR